MNPVDKKVSTQIIVDRPMVEVCGNDGAVYTTSGRGKKGEVSDVKALAEGGAAKRVSLEIHEPKSIWNE